MRLIYPAFTLALLHLFSSLPAQDDRKADCDKWIKKEEIKKHVYFLASDEMRGRDLGSPETGRAAGYIADMYKKTGLLNPPGIDNFLQTVSLEQKIPSDSGIITIDTLTKVLKKDFILIYGNNAQTTIPVVFAGYGLEGDYKDLDVKGKMVLVKGGEEGNNEIMNIFHLIKLKQHAAFSRGASGVIELIPQGQYPWQMISHYLGEERTEMKSSDNEMFYIWMNDNKNSIGKIASALSGLKVNLAINGLKRHDVPAFNVTGILEGSDPVLKKEYIVVSAHYDHIGVGRPVNGDSIYNGARDNAVGVACLIASADYLKNVGSKRSVLFLACTGEEKGLLGSSWYVDNPLIPLKETVFELNTDEAGYNDTSLLTVIDLKRTTADSIIIKASEINGLKVNGDPVPEQMLYDRSDNVSFAKYGVPSVNLSPGITSFNEELMKYYHNPKDEPGNLDYDYLTRYVKSFALTLKMLSDSNERPFWLKGDVYEKAGLSLYGSRP
jgi:aminopeptidase YwaD